MIEKLLFYVRYFLHTGPRDEWAPMLLDKGRRMQRLGRDGKWQFRPMTEAEALDDADSRIW